MERVMKNFFVKNWRGMAWIAAALLVAFLAAHFMGLLWTIPIMIFGVGAFFWKRWRRMAIILFIGGFALIIVMGFFSLMAFVKSRKTVVVERATVTTIQKPTASTPIIVPVAVATPAPIPAPTSDDLQSQLMAEKEENDRLRAQKDNIGRSNFSGEKINSTDDAGSDAGKNAEPIIRSTREIAEISPIGGDEGSPLAKMQYCWYSHINEMTCKGFLLNQERQSHLMDLMDSEGTADNGDESRHFITWRFGGSIRYAGGSDRITLVQGVKNTFLFTFIEPNGGVAKVSFTLNISGMDAINHAYAFANIPVEKHPY
jgi:hypothetical protein